MKKSRFCEEQIAFALRQADAGAPVGDVCRQLGVSEASFRSTASSACPRSGNCDSFAMRTLG